ncbi:Hpt domain-containing protein [Bradyrhizobium sp. ARR65]|uniref:Hpt domain-containing protein n=1 Tax=Bradyrhizobium sp. ARR65 TaxID=1040989 RepID=UPI0004678C62|nr:Hpt domain-containing protein [Bradyrhizobium sp. ARR65]
MPLSPPRIDQIPSPPLAPSDDPIDVAHLKRMTLSDAGLEREVLAMFLQQTAQLLTRLATRPADAAALAHTLKGSARAIGACRVAACAAALEAAIRTGDDPAQPLTALDHAVAEARASIEAILASSSASADRNDPL